MVTRLKSLLRAFALGLTLSCCLPAHAIRIDFVPALQTKFVGDAVGVDVVVSGLTAANQIVSTFDLDVTYNPAILQATGVTYGSALGGGGASSLQFTPSLGGGVIDFAESSFLLDAQLDALQGDAVTLATLSFLAIGPGTSSLQFVQDAFFFLTGTFNNLGIPQDLNPDIGGGRITVTAAVPLPGSLALLALGLMLLGVGQRIRNNGTARR